MEQFNINLNHIILCAFALRKFIKSIKKSSKSKHISDIYIDFTMEILAMKINHGMKINLEYLYGLLLFIAFCNLKQSKKW